MGLSKLGPWKVAGPPFRRDAASVTSESCAWRRHNRAETRVWSLSLKPRYYGQFNSNSLP
ncbi:hypothetical protein F2Q70_00012605 [Brassica cretica]|uniref:Uncharacterized protein n=1 Tax=Brassica cretica TaxID=69181 RepID=A0A8S9M8B8_BRACR|nr:hypothetical protein F2Q70_00012605 [Brassica cretica]KAF3546141.1 hypothetical protein DY000_02008767 [Brassica cretica]